MINLVEFCVDIMLLLIDFLILLLIDRGLVDVGERCGVFLLMGDLECLGKILVWFVLLLG